MNDTKRIIIIGSSGGGKSTLAGQLGGITGLPVIHLDKEFWNPNWVETPKDIWQEKVKELLKGEQWIIDGNYGGTMKIRTEAADTIIYLDFNRFICLYRVIKRRLQNQGKTRPDMCEGCKEKIDFEFLKWVWTYPKKKPGIAKLLESLKGKNIIVLKSRKEVEGFLKSIFDSSGYPLDEYIEVDDDKVEFPKEINIALAVCTKECDRAEYIVEGSTQICQQCGTVMHIIRVKKYRLAED